MFIFTPRFFKNLFVFFVIFILLSPSFAQAVSNDFISSLAHRETTVATSTPRIIVPGTAKKDRERARGLHKITDFVPVPKIVIGTTSSTIVSDFSQINWDEKVGSGFLNTKELFSQDVLSQIGDVPQEILDAVAFYSQEVTRVTDNRFTSKNEKDQKKADLKKGLASLIETLLVKRGDLPENYFELKRNGAVFDESQIIDLSDSKNSTYQVSDTDIKRKEMRVKASFGSFEKFSGSKKSTSFLSGFIEGVRSIFSVPVVHAQTLTPQEHAETYLLAGQNGDGSWGLHGERFFYTIAALDTLYAAGEETSQAYQNGLTWLNFFITDNTDHLAQTIRVLDRSDWLVDDLPNYLALDQDSTTGGFPFDRDYQPDALTTARALRALTETGYQDQGTDPSVTIWRALYYLSHAQNYDGGFAVSAHGESLATVTAEVVRSLYPYLGTMITLGNGSTVSITDVIDDAIVFIRGRQASDGLWDNDVSTTAFIYATLKTVPVSFYYAEAGLAAIASAQLTNGSLDNNLYKTALFLEALQEVSGVSSYVEMYDLDFSGSTETGVATTLDISLRNNGQNVVDSGTLQLFIDDVFIASFDIQALSLSLDPEESGVIHLSLTDTWSLVDDVTITVFFDDGSGNEAPGAWYEEEFTFTANANGDPGIPTYFIAQKSSFNGLPAFNVRWDENDVDPDRAASTIFWREVGTTTWTAYDWTGTGNGLLISAYGIGTDKYYEVTIGARKDQLGAPEWTMSGDVAIVHLNADDTLYVSDIVSGRIYNSGMLAEDIGYFGYDFGFEEGTPYSGTTDENGVFTENGLQNGKAGMWVSQLPYQKFVTTFDVAEDESLNDVEVYTRVIPDDQAPTISALGVSGSPVFNNQYRTVYLIGSDDVGITHANFEYYDVATETWKLIGIRDALDGLNSITFDWFIPNSVLGTGYKLRATAYDYADNPSTLTESSEFEVIAGNAAPEFTFVKPNGVLDVADDSFLISWNDADPDTNALIDLYYDVDTDPYNTNSILIATDIEEDDFSDQYLWNTSVVDEGSYLVYAVVSDLYNADLIVYASGAVTIEHESVVVSGPAPKVRYPMNGAALTGLKHDNATGDSLFDLVFASGNAVSVTGYNNETDGTYQFSGAERISMGAAAPVTPGDGPMTISFRVKSWLNSGEPIKYILTGNAPSESYSISTAIYQGKLLTDVTWRANGQETGIGAYSNMEINDNEWHKVDFIVYNEDGVGKYDLYIDGELDSTRAHASSAYSINDLSNGWNIGTFYNRHTGGYVAYLKDTLIDDVTLYDFALSEEEIDLSIPAPPVITLVGEEEIGLFVGDTFTEPGYSAYDFQDGDLTSSVVVTGSVDTTTAGSYTLTYSVSDSDGLAAQEPVRTIIVSEEVAGNPPLISYEFNGSLGGAIKPSDYGTYGIDLTPVGSLSSVSGHDGTADGSYFIGSSANRYLEVNDNAAFPTGSFTIETWIKLEDTNSSDAQIIANRAGSVGNRAIIFQRGFEGAGDSVQFRIYGVDNTIWDLRSSHDLPRGQWVHIAAVFESSVATRIYINGVLDGENTTNIPAAIKDVSAKFIIGQHELEKSNANTELNGAIDYLRIYDYAKTGAEVASDYSQN